MFSSRRVFVYIYRSLLAAQKEYGQHDSLPNMAYFYQLWPIGSM